MKVAFLADTHFGVRQDHPALMRNQIRFLENIFFPTLDAEGITSVVHLGDLVDRRKSVTFQTLTMLHQHWFQPLQARNISLDWLLGNHDVTFRTTNQINASFVGYGYDVMVHSSLPTIKRFGDTPVLLAPWRTADNAEVWDHAVEHAHASVMCAHLELMNFEMYKGQPSHDGLDPAAFDRFTQVFTGHYHHHSHKGNITYLGAPYEMTWADYDDLRGFWIWDSDTLETRHIQNTRPTYYRFVYDDKQMSAGYRDAMIAEIEADAALYEDAIIRFVVKSKVHSVWYDSIVQAFHAAGAYEVLVVDEELDTVVEDVTEEQTALGQWSNDTRSMLAQYLDQVPVESDGFKKDLLTSLVEIYEEASERMQLEG